MTLPKTLQADSETIDSIRDEKESLAITVFSPGSEDEWTTEELRNEIIVRWNSYETLRDTITTLNKLFDDLEKGN